MSSGHGRARRRRQMAQARQHPSDREALARLYLAGEISVSFQGKYIGLDAYGRGLLEHVQVGEEHIGHVRAPAKSMVRYQAGWMTGYANIGPYRRRDGTVSWRFTKVYGVKYLKV